jgi:HPt (histidine-containing phosphotransfer) domain-containing protein
MTGNAFVGDREKCLESGMDDYISKPVRVTELQAAIEKWGPGRPNGATPSAPRSVLDPAIIGELRAMPPENGVTMLRELIDLFLASASADIARIRESLRDPQELLFHSHALKSMSLNLGATRVIDLSRQLEDRARLGKLNGLDKLVDDLEQAYQQAEKELSALRDKS